MHICNVCTNPYYSEIMCALKVLDSLQISHPTVRSTTRRVPAHFQTKALNRDAKDYLALLQFWPRNTRLGIIWIILVVECENEKWNPPSNLWDPSRCAFFGRPQLRKVTCNCSAAEDSEFQLHLLQTCLAVLDIGMSHKHNIRPRMGRW